jgi:competence protein ComEA
VNLRLPLVAGVVAVAGAAALVRALHPAALPPAVAGIESPPPASAAPPFSRRHGRRNAALPGGRVVVYVAGEVAHRGVYTLPAADRAVDALAAAGGPLADADLVAVNLAAPLADGEEIAVLPKGAVAGPARTRRAAAAGASPRRRTSRRGRRPKRAPEENASDGPSEVVDINSADENELETLPGVGAALASRIVEFREANGPYTSLDDLLDVGGVTQRKLDDLQPYAVVR